MRGGTRYGEWNEKLPPICPHCSYNLTGVPQARCPECGRGVAWGELRQQARLVYHSLRNVEDANDWVRIGYYLGGAGWAMLLVSWWAGVAVFGAVIAVLAALATIGAGAQVFRMRRLPRWSDEYLPQRPNMFGACADVLVGLGLLAASVALQ